MSVQGSMSVRLVLASALAASIPIADAQSPAFAVASIRVNRDPSDRPMFIRPVLEKGGRVLMRNQTLSDMILAAYFIAENQLFFGSDCARSTGYELEARAPVDVSTATARAMLRRLLADRFSLTVHPERREVPLFELRVAARSGQPGPQLRPATAQCAPVRAPEGLPSPPPPANLPIQNAPLMADGPPRRCASIFRPGDFSGRALSMDVLAGELAEFAGRPVVNRTGLTGEFDFDLTFAPSLTPMPSAGAAIPPELTTALREQLGLSLESARGPVQVIVIDRAEWPTEN